MHYDLHTEVVMRTLGTLRRAFLLLVADPYCGVEEPSFEQPEAPEPEPDDEQTAIDKYRRLMNLVSDGDKKPRPQEPEMEMEITWEIGTKVSCVFRSSVVQSLL